MVQWVKDLALSLQWLGSLLWQRFDSCLSWELPHALGAAKKKERPHQSLKMQMQAAGAHHSQSHTLSLRFLIVDICHP